MELELGLGDKYDILLPKIQRIGGVDYPINLWTIKETNCQLAYLTHGFVRYYGKFPSTIAGQLLQQYPAPRNGILIDNFSGSGTSLVEAARRGIQSIGIDINPVAVLAGRVKTRIYNITKLRKDIDLINAQLNKDLQSIQVSIPNDDYLHKWFFQESISEIIRLKQAILSLKEEIDADFFALAFFSIIRRVSKAYDGEVRPHINKTKKIRSPFCVFNKTVTEMIEGAMELANNYLHSIPAQTFLLDNRTDIKTVIPKGKYWLAISHPPYLNCFDYIPVYKLELSWAEDFEWLWDGITINELKKKELKSWPAKNNLVKSYYYGLYCGYQKIYDLQEKGDKLAIVIGDCTINGVLEKVHEKLITLVESIGYKTIELNYRTTYYTTGKYSYQDRANYHGDNEEKKDAIIVFQKK